MRALRVPALFAAGAALSLEHLVPPEAEGAGKLGQVDSMRVKMNGTNSRNSAAWQKLLGWEAHDKANSSLRANSTLRTNGTLSANGTLSDAFWLGAAAAKEGEVTADLVETRFRQSSAQEASLDLKFAQMERRIANVVQENEELRAAEKQMERELSTVKRKIAQMEFGGRGPASDNRLGQMEERIAKIEHAGDQSQTAEQRADDQKQRRENFEEAHLILEEARASRDLSVAHSAVDRVMIPLMAKEKVWQNNRLALETATTGRLLEEAEGLRAAADNAVLPREQVLRMLDISGQKLDHMAAGVAKAASNNTGALFQDRLEGMCHKSALASAHLLESIVHKIGVLADTHSDYDDRLFLELLARFFNDTKDETRKLHESTSAISKKLHEGYDKLNPESLSATLSLALDGVTGNIEFKNHILQLDTYALSHTSMGQEVEQGCRELERLFVSNLLPSFHGIGHMRSSLDNMTKVMPSILHGDKLSKARAMMQNRTNNLLNMAYAQHLALKGVSSAMLRDAVPIVMQRLHCNFASDSSETRLGLAAAATAAVAAAWMAL